MLLTTVRNGHSFGICTYITNSDCYVKPTIMPIEIRGHSTPLGRVSGLFQWTPIDLWPPQSHISCSPDSLLACHPFKEWESWRRGAGKESGRRREMFISLIPLSPLVSLPAPWLSKGREGKWRKGKRRYLSSLSNSSFTPSTHSNGSGKGIKKKVSIMGGEV